MVSYTLPKGLVPGNTIGIVAPSAPLTPHDPEPVWNFLRSLGYEVKLGCSVQDEWGYLAGRDEARADDINRFFDDSRIAAILCLRGGYGAARLLDLLDYEKIAAHPKLFIGFSDITALHTVLQERCHMASVHGPMAMSLARKPTVYTRSQFVRGLARPFAAGPFTLPPRHHLQALYEGLAQGPVRGGNLCLLSSLCGTPYELDGTGSLLFLEEVGVEAYAIDRMLRQLEQSGLIDRVRGILFGGFTGCKPLAEKKGEFTIRQVLQGYARRWQKPALMGVPAGHGRNNGWLPLGVPASMIAGRDGSASFSIEKG